MHILHLEELQLNNDWLWSNSVSTVWENKQLNQQIFPFVWLLRRFFFSFYFHQFLLLSSSRCYRIFLWLNHARDLYLLYSISIKSDIVWLVRGSNLRLHNFYFIYVRIMIETWSHRSDEQQKFVIKIVKNYSQQFSRWFNRIKVIYFPNRWT